MSMTLLGLPGGEGGGVSRHPAPGGGPPFGNTGGKPTVQYDTRTVMVHWLRVTHPVADRDRLRAAMVSRWGEPDPSSGRWRHSHGERFANGALLLWGRTKGERDRYCVDSHVSAFEYMEETKVR